MEYSKGSLAKYLEALSSSAVSPGGGSAAALTGALGVALAEMTARINHDRYKKKIPRAPETQAVQRIARLAALRRSLCGFITEDARAFARISKHFKKEKTSASFQRALKEGARIPFQICERAAEAARLARLEKPRTGRWLASDLAEAGVLLRAAFEAGRLNVEINLNGMADKRFAAGRRRELGDLQKKVRAATR